MPIPDRIRAQTLPETPGSARNEQRKTAVPWPVGALYRCSVLGQHAARQDSMSLFDRNLNPVFIYPTGGQLHQVGFGFQL